MNFTGRITEIKEIKTGLTKKGDEWSSLDFEVEESNPQNIDYPQIASFSFFKMGEYKKFVDDFSTYNKLGDEVNVDFSMKCQKYTKDGIEKKFYKNECFKLEKVASVETETYKENEVGNDLNDSEPDDLPF